MPKIVKVVFKDVQYQRQVFVAYDKPDDYEEQDEMVLLFRFYADEISFSENELIGLTREEAFELRRNKDIAYLQS